MNDPKSIEELTEEVRRTKHVLGTLIVWLVLELGEKAVDKLLAQLDGEDKKP
jgi:hypothetical protein